LRPLYTM